MRLPEPIRQALLRFASRVRQSRLPDVYIGGSEQPYIKRWWVIPRNKWFNIYLHEIHRSDDDRALHDHPWWNVSLLLSGHYIECVPLSKNALTFRKCARLQGSIIIRMATQAHRLEIVPTAAPVVTLFLTGPVIRKYGFYCPKGWKPWDKFTAAAHGGSPYGRGPGCGD